GLLDDDMEQMRVATSADVSAAARRWLNRAAYVLDLEPAVAYRPSSADADRSRMPGPTAFKPADFPKTDVTTLPNGLKVRHAQWHGGPLVAASLIVRGGAGVDPRDQRGLARLTASLITAGTAKMSEEQLTDALARLDTSVQSSTNADAITLTLVTPKDQLKAALDLFGAMVASPSFPAAAVEREKKKQLQELQSVPNTPRLLARATVRRLL